MNGLEADYDILVRHFLLYQTSLKINVADPVKVGWNIFDSRIIRRMICESMLSTNTEITPALLPW